MDAYDTTKMLKELEAAGVVLDLNSQPDLECCYNYIIHMYDVWFLANNWEHREKSKEYKPSGTRNWNTGKFPQY